MISINFIKILAIGCQVLYEICKVHKIKKIKLVNFENFINFIKNHGNQSPGLL